jgi:hypothetical protein
VFCFRLSGNGSGQGQALPVLREGAQEPPS